MRSTLIDCISNNTFIPFPDNSFEDGTDGKNNFVDYFEYIHQNNKSVEELLNDQTYTTWNFCGSDDSKICKSDPKSYNPCYENKEVKYTLNSFGYRTKNFNKIDWGNSIIIFGCSVIQGVGLDDSHTLSSFLEKEMDLPVINMGVGGSSNEFHLYNSNILLTQYPKPKAVIYYLSGLQRYTFYNWDNIEHRGIWTDNETQVKKNRSNSIIRSIIASSTMNNIWSSRTSYIEFTLDDLAYKFMNKLNKNPNRFYLGSDWESLTHLNLSHQELKSYAFPGYDFARDMSHPGEESNKVVARSLAKILKSRLV